MEGQLAGHPFLPRPPAMRRLPGEMIPDREKLSEASCFKKEHDAFFTGRSLNGIGQSDRISAVNYYSSIINRRHDCVRALINVLGGNDL